MSNEYPTYDFATRIKALRGIAKQYEDGLKLLRLVGPELHPEFNDQVGVAQCQTREHMIAATNRAGKSLVSAAKIASILRDVPLIAWNGEEIHCRPERWRGKPLTVWVVGYQLNHIGDTIFRLLFEPGQFNIIDDPDTGIVRSFRPWEEWDAKNADLARPAPPLIPPSAIDHDSWVWESKGAKQFAKVDIVKSRLFAYPSTAEVKKGDAVHVIWIDELAQYSEHYSEWIARLTDHNGMLFWSTMIYPQCPAIGRVIDRAETQKEEVERGERPVDKVFSKVFYFRQTGNPYIPKESTEINREIFESEGDDIVKQRIDGGNVYDSTLIYPFFSKQRCAAIPEDKQDWDELAEVLDSLGGLPPKDWTHELIVDPGAQKPAVLFCAVPPKSWKDESGKTWSLWGNQPFFVMYDEIYGRRYSLQELVKQIKGKMRGIRFRRFIMDMQGGRISSMTGGPPAHRQFSKAFGEEGIESEDTGINFMAGGTDFQDRRRIVERWMQIQACGYPQLRIVTKRCPNLVSQLSRNQFAMNGGIVTDKEARRERNDLRQCAEYYASRGPEYVYIEQGYKLPDEYLKLMEWEERMFGKPEGGGKRCHFGPGVAP